LEQNVKAQAPFTIIAPGDDLKIPELVDRLSGMGWRFSVGLFNGPDDVMRSYINIEKIRKHEISTEQYLEAANRQTNLLKKLEELSDKISKYRWKSDDQWELEECKVRTSATQREWPRG
jgi:hypothetical protein